MNYKNILIVDDSETSRMIIKRCLSIIGMEPDQILEAEDGIKALTLLYKETIDLIITDLNMPRMDGVTFIRKLKINDKVKDLPVIVISSMGNDTLEHQLREVGVFGIIRKPLSPPKLMDILGGESTW